MLKNLRLLLTVVSFFLLGICFIANATCNDQLLGQCIDYGDILMEYTVECYAWESCDVAGTKPDRITETWCDYYVCDGWWERFKNQTIKSYCNKESGCS